MPATDKYGQEIPYSLLTDAADAQQLGKGIADAAAGRSVMRFASAANRGATLAGDSAPQEGMVAYLKDADRLDYYDGANWNPLTPGPWIPFPVASGISYNSGSPAYRLVNGSVELRGTLRRTDGEGFAEATTTHVGTLPGGYWPAYYRYYVTATEWAAQLFARIEIDPTNGHVNALIQSGSPHWICLDGISSSL